MHKYVIAAAVALATIGCQQPSLRHFSYTLTTNKVWYHWAHPNGDHSIVVCDLNEDGSETNCVESEI